MILNSKLFTYRGCRIQFVLAIITLNQIEDNCKNFLQITKMMFFLDL